MIGNPNPPEGISDFGSALLWMVATRATALVDRVYATGLANATKEYGRVHGHDVPTPSLVAWLLLAAERDLPPEEIPRGDPDTKRRHHSLRTRVGRAFSGEPRIFKESWLRDLAVMCGFSDADLRFLIDHRSDEYGSDEYGGEGEAGSERTRAGLRDAIAASFGSRPAAAVQAAATRTLPLGVAAFTGRRPELRLLTETASRSSRRVTICAINGMPGVGKTTLAVHAARQLGRGYPDGLFFLNLRGHAGDQRPVSAEDALATLLLTSGIAPQWIPKDPDARAALWRDHLENKRMLLVLDDAVSSAQVRPLLPGTAGSLVLITSRSRLIALGEARPVITLRNLPPGEASRLFVRLAGRRGLKVADGAVAEVVRQCDYLPAAIALMAGKLAHHPAWMVVDLATALSDKRNRLAQLHAEDVSIAAAFDLSYQDLTADQQRVFRRLSLHPGPLLDAYATAALDDTDVATARRHLEGIYAQHLIEEPARGYVQFQDLIGEYARTRAAADDAGERGAAVDRLLDYYLHAAAAASRRLARRAEIAGTLPAGNAAVRHPELSTREQAAAWLETELPSLCLVAEQAVARGRPMHAVQLTAALSDFLRDRGHWDLALPMHKTAVTIARGGGDLIAEADARNNLGVMYRMTGDLPAAVAAHQQALRLFRDLGQRQGQASALRELGVVYRLQDDYAASAGSVDEAFQLFGDLGDRQGQAEVLGNRGFSQFMTGEDEESIGTLTEALRICGEIGDRQGQAEAFSYLSVAQRIRSDYPAAIASLAESLRLFKEVGDLQGQANALNNLGVVQRMTDDYPAAAASLGEALRLFEQAGNRQGQANALNSLGVVLRIRGDYPAAADLHRKALALYRRLNVRLGQANALNFLGVVRRLTGDHGAAVTEHEQALQIFCDLGDRQGQADTLNFLGAAQQSMGDTGAAAASQNQALAEYVKLADRRGEADARHRLGGLQVELGELESADANLSRALDVYSLLGTRIGQAQALISLGELASRRADPLAAERFAQALTIALTIGAPLEETLAREGLARCGPHNRLTR